MFRILAIPDHSPGELHFRLFGIPVRVHPLFWIYSLFMASNRETGQAIIWVLVVFASVLIHELGHGIAMKAFGERAEIVLYTWGGLAIPVLGRYLKPAAQIVISLAGPAAGFLVAVLVAQLAITLGGTLHFSLQYFVIPNLDATFPPPATFSSPFAYLYKVRLINDLLWVNLTWGIVNLLPIYPLDGGQATRTLFGLGRLRLSLLLSVLTATAFAILGLVMQSIYVVAFFGILAAGSAQEIEALPRRNYGPSRAR